MTRRRWVVACASVTGLVAASLGGTATAGPVPAPAATQLAGPHLGTAEEREPVRTVQGTRTELWNPSQVAVAPDGALVVANEGDFKGSGGSVTVHAAGASGDAAPRRRIVGARTGLVQPSGVAVDSEGRIYVADAATDTISVFAPGADGDVAPVQQHSGPHLDGPTGLDVVSNRLAVANCAVATCTDPDAADGATGSVVVLAVDATGRIGATPERVLHGGDTALVQPFRVVLRDGALTVATVGGRVLTYAPGAAGGTAPVRTLTASRTGGAVTGLALDDAGRIHVAAQYTPAPVQVFAAGASGPAAPVASLTGELHELDLPRGLALTPSGQVVVTDEADDALSTYDSLLADTPAPVVRPPGKVRNLTVAGGPRTARRLVTWRAPVADGGAKVTRYRVVVKKGRRTVERRTVAKRRTVLRRGQLPAGRLVVRVTARNSAGFGPVAVKRFRVRR